MSQINSANRHERPGFDFWLFLLAFALAIFGVIAITAATYTYSEENATTDLLARITSSYYGKRQGLFLIISFVMVPIMAYLPFVYRWVRSISGILYLVGLGLLVAVLLVGSTTSGVTGWFSIVSGYMLQPSEFAKLMVIIHLAKFFAKKDNPVANIKDFMTMGVIMGAPVLLIFLQGELGTAMVFIAIYFIMMIFGGVDWRIIAGILFTGIVVALLAIFVMRASGSYRFDRILAFVDPSKATADSLLQSENSKIAIGNGGLTGMGMYADGTYTALNYVPQDHTDFIFAAIGETWGFRGCILVMAGFCALVLRILILAKRCYDRFDRLIIVGVGCMIMFHVFYNIGMTIGLTPVMGIPLPFLSYGGSNLIASMMGIGLILNINKFRRVKGMVSQENYSTGGYRVVSKKKNRE